MRQAGSVFHADVHVVLVDLDSASPCKKCFELLDAPHKEWIWFEHSGHNPWVAESAAFVDVAVKKVLAGYGLHLRPVDVGKLAFLYLHNGNWDGSQIIPEQWVADSTMEQVKKEDGSGYGELWTVYPESGHYAALGLGGQQIHVYPAMNLIVITAAALESYAEAPEIETMLNNYILPAVESDIPLPENADGSSRLRTSVETAANPILSVLQLPVTALDISGSAYTFDANLLGRESLEFDFEEGADTAQLHLDGFPVLEIGLDNIYRLSTGDAIGEILLRGRWADEQTLVIDYPYLTAGATILGALGETEFRFKFIGLTVEVNAEQLAFGGEPIVIQGSR